MKIKAFMLIFLLAISIVIAGCGNEDLAGEAKKAVDDNPRTSFDITIDVKDSFEEGETVSFDYSMYSDKDISLEYVSIISCRDAPNALLEKTSSTLYAGEKIEKRYVDFTVDESIEPQMCRAIIEVLEPFNYKIEKRFKIDTKPSLDVSIDLCKNLDCSQKSRVFVKGEPIRIDYESNKALEVSARLIGPDKSVSNIDLPYDFTPQMSGTYTLEMEFSKRGYKENKLVQGFSVIDAEPKVESIRFSDAPEKGRSQNMKDMSKYENNEAFLVSDENWKEVLRLYPLTVWTDEVEIYEHPTLLFHQGDLEISIIDDDDLWVDYEKEGIGPVKLEQLKINGLAYEEWIEIFSTVRINYDIDQQNSGYDLDLGESLSPRIYLRPYSEFRPYFIDNIEILEFDYPDSFEMVGGSLLIDVQEEIDYYLSINIYDGYDVPIFLFYSPFQEGFDIDSVIRFLQEYNPERLTIFGDTNQEIDNLLVAEPEFGAGLDEENIQRVQTDDHINYWETLNEVVLVEDNYELALLASTYASLINAPLFFEGDSFDFSGLNVVLIGAVSCPSGASCNTQFSDVEELQQEYYALTGTDKIILVNPADLSHPVPSFFFPEKTSYPLFNLFDKTSLSAPYLSSLNHELILPIELEEVKLDTNCSNFPDRLGKISFVDEFVENKMDNYDNIDYLTILASPNSISQSFTEDCNLYSLYHNYKNSVDNVYGASKNVFFRFHKYLSLVVDDSGNAHIFTPVKIDKLLKLFYQKKDGLSGDLLFSDIMIYDMQYLYELDAGIDSGGNIHLIYLGRLFYEDDFKLYYREYSPDLELLNELVLTGDAKNDETPHIYVDRHDDIHITYSHFIPADESYSEVHYLKISNGGLLFDKIIKEFSVTPQYTYDALLNNNDENVIILPKRIQETNSRFIGVDYITLDNQGNMIDNKTFVNDRQVQQLYSALDEDNKVITFLYSGKNVNGELDQRVYLLKEDNATGVPFPCEYGLTHAMFDLNGLIHLFHGTYLEENNYLVLNETLDIVSSGQFPLIPEGEDFELIVDKIEAAPLDSNRIFLLYNSFSHIAGEDHISWYELGYPENKSYPHFSIRENEQWSPLRHLDGIDVDNKYYLDTGRIYGLTSSDVSTYISEIITNEQQLIINDDAVLFGHSSNIMQIGPAITTSEMNQEGYSWECITKNVTEPCMPLIGYPIDEAYFTDKSYLYFHDHGTPDGWWQVIKSEHLPTVSNTFVFSNACSNSDFERGKSDVFGANVLRKGGSGHFGSSGVAWMEHKDMGNDVFLDYSYFAKDYFLQGGTLGGLFKEIGSIFSGFRSDYLVYGYPAYEITLEHSPGCEDLGGTVTICGEVFPPDCSQTGYMICCGDDLEENYKYMDCADSSIYADSCYDNEEDNACCDDEKDCVMDGVCHTRNRETDYDPDSMWTWTNAAGTTGHYKCLNTPGMIFDCDQDPDVCENLEWACNVDETRPYGTAAGWAFEGENEPFGGYGDSWGRGIGTWGSYDPGPDAVINGAFEECCGDDQDEYLISGNGYTRCCNHPTDYVDANGNCIPKGKTKLISEVPNP